MKDLLANNKNYTAYLLIGGNIGDRQKNLAIASQHIAADCGNIITTSFIYKTAAWGITNQPDFYNQVLVLNTQLLPNILITTLLSIEEKMGRKRIEKMGPRIIDIDILLIDELIIQTPELKIPHPLLTKRRFALLPLAEVAGNIIHPVEKKPIYALLKDCEDMLDVQKISTTTV